MSPLPARAFPSAEARADRDVKPAHVVDVSPASVATLGGGVRYPAAAKTCR